MLKTLKKQPVLFVILVVLVMLGLHLDVLQVSIMEARNFITAREMITDNHWLLTTMNGEARYQKPPLPSWICAGFAFLFGTTDIYAFRLPAVLFAAITGVFTYLLSKKLTKNKMHSCNNALILVTSISVIEVTFEAPSDIITHGFMLMGIYYLFQLFQKCTNHLKFSVIGGIFIGCSILSKGPVSLYALMLPFLIAYGITFKYNKQVLSYLVLCLGVAILIGSSWYIFVRLEDPQTFKAIAAKETGNWLSYKVRPFYYYWSFFIQSGIWTIPAFISLLYPFMKSRVSDLKTYKFSLYWTIFAVILLSIVPEKKSRYLMPVLIPLSINTGFYIQFLINQFKTLSRKRELLPVYFNFGLIGIIALVFPLAVYLFLGEHLSGFWLTYSLTSAASVGIGSLIILKLTKKNIKSVFQLTVLFFVSLLAFGLPLSNALKSENYKSYSELKSHSKKQQINVYALRHIPPEMVWEFGTTILPIKTEDTIHFPEEQSFGLLIYDINPEELELIKSRYSMKKVDTYDLNVLKPESGKYRKRLKSDYYELSKR